MVFTCAMIEYIRGASEAHEILAEKSSDSKSLYCAGYYCIKFEKGWVKSFCPKKITLERYPYKGPFKTEIEMKQVLANVSK